MTAWSRRGFLHGMLIGGAGLTLAACGGGGQALRIARADQTGELAASLYVTVHATGRVSLIVNKAEIGQGVSTGYATLVAEELCVPIDHVDVHYAGSNKAMRTSANMQLTGGSTSMFEAYTPLRQAAAAAREMLIAAAAQTWRVAPAACRAVDGHVVRGDTRLPYGELTRRAARLEVPAHPTLKPASEHTLIGKVDRRVDLRGKIDGTAIYGIDVTLPGMCNAYPIFAPVFGARPTHVAADRARQRPGVIDVVTFDWGVAVVAEKLWQARAAARDVEVTWSAGSLGGLDTDQLTAALRAHDAPGLTVEDRGDVDAALARAEHRIGGTFEAPYLAHAPLEPNNATARVTGDRAEVWAPSQSPTVAQAFVADALGIAMDDVDVHVTLCGGGFGRRALGDACAQAAQIARHVKRPVKLTWSREDDMRLGWYRPIYSAKVDAGVAGGKITGARVRVRSQSILLSGETLVGAALSQMPEALGRMVTRAGLALFSTNSVGDILATEGLTNTPYRFGGGFQVASEPVHTKLPVLFWRSVGNSVTGFIMESLIDELAAATRQDPFALRRTLLPPGTRQTRVLERLEQLSGWATPPAPGVGRGLARHFAFETEVAQVAEVAFEGDRIRVRKVYCVVDCGMAINPDIVRAQMEGGIIFGLSAALDQQITLVKGVVQQRNFDTFPLLRMHECPEIVVEILASDERPTGVGEPGLPPIAPAVANAIFQLTGVRLRRMPLQRAWNERGAA